MGEVNVESKPRSVLKGESEERVGKRRWGEGIEVRGQGGWETCVSTGAIAWEESLGTRTKPGTEKEGGEGRAGPGKWAGSTNSTGTSGQSRERGPELGENSKVGGTQKEGFSGQTGPGRAFIVWMRNPVADTGGQQKRPSVSHSKSPW